MANLYFDINKLFNLYLAPRLLLNDGIIINSDNYIIEKLPFISELLLSKFKEGIIKKVNNNIINLQIPLIKLDISSDFIKLIKKPYLFEGGDIGLYQDYIVAKGYGLDFDIRDIFDLNKIDFESYFEDFDGEIIDLYRLYFSEIMKYKFVIYASNSIESMKNKEKYTNQLRQFVIDFGTDIHRIIYIIKTNIFDGLDNENNDIIISTLIKVLNNIKYLKLRIIKEILSFKYLGKERREIINKKIKNIIYNNLKNYYSKYEHRYLNKWPHAKYSFTEFIVRIYPIISKVEPDITNFIIKIIQIADKSSRSLIQKLLYLYINSGIIPSKKILLSDINNITIGIIDSINKIGLNKSDVIEIHTEGYHSHGTKIINFSQLLEFSFNNIFLNDKRLLLKIKTFILKLFSFLSISDIWMDYLNVILNNSYEEMLNNNYDEYNEIKNFIISYLADDIIKMATIKKHPNLDGIKDYFTYLKS